MQCCQCHTLLDTCTCVLMRLCICWSTKYDLKHAQMHGLVGGLKAFPIVEHVATVAYSCVLPDLKALSIFNLNAIKHTHWSW